MVTFKTDRPDNKMYILKKFAVKLLFLVLVSACLFFLFALPVTYFILFFLLLQEFIDTAVTERLREISFDTKSRQVIFFTQNIFRVASRKAIAF
jgi:hypothetical protein